MRRDGRWKDVVDRVDFPLADVNRWGVRSGRSLKSATASGLVARLREVADSLPQGRGGDLEANLHIQPRRSARPSERSGGGCRVVGGQAGRHRHMAIRYCQAIRRIVPAPATPGETDLRPCVQVPVRAVLDDPVGIPATEDRRKGIRTSTPETDTAGEGVPRRASKGAARAVPAGRELQVGVHFEVRPSSC